MKGINEYTCTHQIACLALTCCPSLGILRLLPITNESEKETYGNGASQGTVPVYGLDTAHSETPQRYPVCVCSSESREEDGRSLLCSLVKGRADEQRTSTRKTRLTQKIKPPERWQTKQFTAVRLFPKIGTRKEQPLLYPAYFLVYEPCLTMSRCRYTEWAHERKKVCS